MGGWSALIIPSWNVFAAALGSLFMRQTFQDKNNAKIEISIRYAVFSNANSFRNEGIIARFQK